MGQSNQKILSPRRRFWQGVAVMALAVVMLFGLFTAGLLFDSQFNALVKKLQIKIQPNFNDGVLIAEFPDIYKFPSLPSAIAHEPPLRRFSVRRVQFLPFTGLAVAPRLNLVFEFDAYLPAPLGPGFALAQPPFPVIHVYIDSPLKETERYASEKIAGVDFQERTWDYQVIIDGAHKQAQIFDADGKPVGVGLGLYFNYDRDKPKLGAKPEPGKILRTRITAALPMALVGDPAKGEWSFYVIAWNLGQPEFRSVVLPPGAGELAISPDGRPKLMPLKIHNPGP